MTGPPATLVIHDARVFGRFGRNDNIHSRVSKERHDHLLASA